MLILVQYLILLNENMENNYSAMNIISSVSTFKYAFDYFMSIIKITKNQVWLKQHLRAIKYTFKKIIS